LWIQWDPDTRSPRRIRNEAPRPLAPAAPRDLVAHAERLLADNGELFGFRPGVDELRRIGTSEENGLTWVGFVQSYRGVPVRDRGYGVWLRPDGRLHMLEGAFSQGIDIEGVPAVDEAEAIGIATDPADRGRVRSATLVIETSRGARLVWEIDTSFEWVVVDARSGVVVSRRLIIY
jgi:Zn-dependent metalloprotease